MSIRKIILFFLVSLLFFISKDVFAYEIETHAYLTDEVINFSGSQPASGFRSFIIDGSRREDDGVRSFNHFYDPVNNIGLHNIALGMWEKSKDWADDSVNQNGVKYKVPAVIASILSAVESGKINDISAETDFTWHRAVEFYVNDESEKAFFLLGHILHLMEDASVPDHTRNDLHPGNSPYENWTAQFNLENKDADLQGRLNGKNSIQLDDLTSFFDGLANYSNNNFYSKDTIGIGDYKLPASDFTKRINKYYYAFKEDKENGDYPLFVYKKYSGGLIFSDNSDIDIKTENESEVVLSYWFRLSTKTIQYGAGVLNLFIKEAEAAKNDPNRNKQPEQKSFIASVIDGAGNVISTVSGAIQKVIGALENILKQNSAETDVPQINAPLEDSENNVATTVLNQETISESTSVEQIDSELAAGEQVKEDIESLPTDSEIYLTVADREAIAKMLARLDDLMKQAIELKTKIDSMGDGSTSRTIENQVAGASGFGGTANSTASGPASATSTNDDSGLDDGSTSSTVPASTTTETVASSTLDHIVISELLFDAVGSDEGKEFIELYNPTAQVLDLGGWSLREIIGDSTSSNSLASFGGSGHVSDRTIIPTKSFLLIGFHNYDPGVYGGRTANIERTTLLPNGGDIHDSPQKVQILLKDGDGDIVDSVSYDDSSIPEPGYSLERKTSVGSNDCVTAAGINEFYGHNCNAGNASDFEARTNPNPQNSLSLPEPRRVPTLSGATLVYASSSVNLNFGWNGSADAEGVTSTILYEIKDASSSEIFATTTGAMAIQRGINEIGKSYDFIIQALDRDGLGSATSSLSVHVPSFFDGLYFYADPRNPGSNVFDAYYGAYPFIPGTTNTWKMIMFYVNTDALKDEYLVEESGFAPSDTSNVVSLSYIRCSGPGSTHSDNFLLLPEGDHCSIFGGGLYPQGFSGLEDSHFIISITIPAGSGPITTSTYVTTAFYDWESRSGPYAGFRLVAVDKQGYYFQSSIPSSAPPNPPADITVQFDDLHSRLNLSWPASRDPDSLDDNLSYEVNYSTSTEFSTSSWQSAGNNMTATVPVTFGNSYKLGMRAIDDFGNVSLPVEKNWSFPEGFIQLPFQRESGGDPIGDSSGAGQRILVSNNASVSRVAMVMAMDGGAYSVTDTFVEIRADNSGGIGDLMASSSDISRSWPMSDQPVRDEFIFNFPQPVQLLANTYYWLVPVNGPGTSNRNFIYGSAANPYPDGYWSGNPGADAYFFIR